MLVAYSPPDVSGREFLGRLVALPNDTIEVVGKRLVINGMREGRYEAWQPIIAPRVELTALSNITGEIGRTRVQEGCVFILGDNRANSYDSRSLGCVPRSNVVAILDWWIESGELFGVTTRYARCGGWADDVGGALTRTKAEPVLAYQGAEPLGWFDVRWRDGLAPRGSPGR